MWDKPFRYCIFAAVYEVLFWREEGVEKNDVDWNFIFENAKFETEPDKSELDKLLAKFIDNESAYEIILEKYMANWNKTFPIVKACLFTFLLEKDYLESTQSNVESKEVVSKYIRLSEDLVGGQNVALVHAILSKVTGSSIETKPEPEIEKQD